MASAGESTGGKMTPKNRDILALAVAMSLPSVMTWFEMLVLSGDSPVPALQVLFALAKIGQFAFPAIYMLCVDRGEFGLAKARRRDLALAAALGLVIGLGALGLYWLFLRSTPLFDETGLRLVRWLAAYNLGTPAGYWTMAVLMTVVHAGLEEYYWRWFVLRRLARHVPLGW